MKQWEQAATVPAGRGRLVFWGVLLVIVAVSVVTVFQITRRQQALRVERVHALVADPDRTLLLAATNAGLFAGRGYGGRWESVPGAGGQEFLQLVRQDTRLYGALAGGGLQQSADGGRTWSPAGAGLPGPRVTALAADPHRTGRLLAAVEGHGLAETMDGGNQWRLVQPEWKAGVAALAILPGDVILVGDGAGLWQSGDGGKTLRPVPGLAGPVRALAVAPATPGTVWAAAAGNLWRSGDGGTTWEKVTPIPVVAPSAVTVDPKKSDFVFIAGGRGEVAVSTNGGRSWYKGR